MKKNHWFEDATGLGKDWIVQKDFVDGEFNPDDWEEDMLEKMSPEELGFLEGEFEAESSFTEVDELN